MTSEIRRAYEELAMKPILYNIVAWAYLPKLISCYVFEGIGYLIQANPRLMNNCLISALSCDCFGLRPCNDGNCNALIRLFTYSPIHFKKEVSV